MSNQSRSSRQPGRRAGCGPTRRGLCGLLALGITAGTLLAPWQAWAQSRVLDGPRADGTVGERFDGFAVVRGDAPAAIAQLVAQVNAERRAVYAQRAAADGVPIEAIGRIYAMEIMKSAPPKTWFYSESGQWSQK